MGNDFGDLERKVHLIISRLEKGKENFLTNCIKEGESAAGMWLESISIQDFIVFPQVKRSLNPDFAELNDIFYLCAPEELIDLKALNHLLAQAWATGFCQGVKNFLDGAMANIAKLDTSDIL